MARPGTDNRIGRVHQLEPTKVRPNVQDEFEEACWECPRRMDSTEGTVPRIRRAIAWILFQRGQRGHG